MRTSSFLGIEIVQGGNSGMLYHVVERPQYAVPYVTGPEYQLIDEPNFPEPLEEWQKLGVIMRCICRINQDEGESARRMEQLKIVFDNGHVEHWLNGQKILRVRGMDRRLAR